MNNLLVFPILIPLCTAVILIFLNNKVTLQKWISVISMVLNVGVASMILYKVREEGIQTLHMGGWLPPYGIVFVADMLSAILVLTTAIVSSFCLFYAFNSIGKERERYYFYPFFQFLLVGITGSFLTGDLFNLFVCFEVMLISSYALIVLGGTKRQLRETLKYILINIISSTLFVAAVAYLYGVVGTLNMAHLSLRVAEAGQGGVLNVIAILFIVVFSLKAGLFLFFWLPGSYSVPPAAVTALFGALLTKVGLYALIRMFTLIFYHEPLVTHSWIGWMAAATMILGAIGAVAYKDIHRILNYNVVISVGFIAFGMSVATKESLDGAIFYLLHDMIAKALLFILGGMIIKASGTNQIKEMGGLIKRFPLMGWMFLIAILAIAGIPPFSGFAGKLMLIRGGLYDQSYWLTAISLASSLIVLYSLIRIFMLAFWGEEKKQIKEKHEIEQKLELGQAPIISRGMTFSAFGLFLIVILMGLGSEWVYQFVSVAGDTLINPAIYIDAVLKE